MMKKMNRGIQSSLIINLVLITSISKKKQPASQSSQIESIKVELTKNKKRKIDKVEVDLG